MTTSCFRSLPFSPAAMDTKPELGLVLPTNILQQYAGVEHPGRQAHALPPILPPGRISNSPERIVAGRSNGSPERPPYTITSADIASHVSSRPVINQNLVPTAIYLSHQNLFCHGTGAYNTHNRHGIRYDMSATTTNAQWEEIMERHRLDTLIWVRLLRTLNSFKLINPHRDLTKQMDTLICRPI